MKLITYTLTFKWLRYIGVVLCVCLLISNNAIGNSRLDSLQNQIKYTKDDKLKASLLIACSQIYMQKDREAASIHAKEALSLSQNSANVEGKANAYFQLGRIQQSAGDYKNSSHYYEKAAESFKEIGDTEHEANAMRKSGYVIAKEGDYVEALAIYKSAIEICEANSHPNIKAKILSGISGLYRSQGLYQKALRNGLDALKVQKKLDVSKDITFTLDRIGVIYRSLKDYDEALNYYSQALEIRQSLPDIKAEDIAYSNMVIGDIYLKKKELDTAHNYFEVARGQYEKASDTEGMAFCYAKLGDVALENGNKESAFKFQKKSFDIYQSINHKGGITSSYLKFVKYYLEKGNLNKAEEFANKLLEVAKKSGRQPQVVYAYEHLAEIYEQKNEVEKALVFQKMYLSSKDSLWNYEKTKEMTKMQSSYDLELLEVKAEKLLEENEKKQAQLNASRTRLGAMGIVVFMLLALFSILWRAFKNKMANNRLLQIKNNEINHQKEQLVLAKDNLKEANSNLEVKIKERTSALKRSNEELEKFAYLASHDLKHPLRNIIGFSQLLERDLKAKNKLDDTASEYLGIVIKGTKYMNSLIEDILEFSKFSLSKDNKFVKFNFLELVEAVKSGLKKQIDESGAEFELIGLPTEIVGVRVKIVQLMQNLLSNCLKFRKADTPLKIIIEAKDRDDYWQFDVTDNGIGIKEEYHDIIFQLFKQVNNKQEYAGSGMGLAIGKKIAEQHKGDVWVDSKFGVGTKISFTISKDLEVVDVEGKGRKMMAEV